MMEKLLLIGISDQDCVQQAAERLHLRIVTVQPEQYHQTLGILAGYACASSSASLVPEAEQIPSEGILVMCGLKNSQINRLLTKLQQFGQQQLYKAILTPSNAAWNILQLTHELQLERQKLNS